MYDYFKSIKLQNYSLKSIVHLIFFTKPEYRG